MEKIYNIEEPFVDGLDKNILVIAKQSFHTMFFMKQLWYEMNKKIEIKGFITGEMFPDHEPCSIPIENKKFKLFPWNFNSFDIVVGDYEIDLVSECLSNDTDINDLLELQKEESFLRPSFTINKIPVLTENFVIKLEEISSKNDIPYSSVTYLTRIITSGGDIKTIRAYKELLKSYFSILVPKTLSKDKQVKLILKISNQIYQLLIESFWIILLIDWIEYGKMLCFAKNADTFADFKKYITEQIIYPPLINKIEGMSHEEIIKYVEHQYQAAIGFHPLMAKFINQYLLNIAIKYLAIVDKETSFKSHVKPGNSPEVAKEYTDAYYDETSLQIILDYIFKDKSEERKNNSYTKYTLEETQSLAYDFLIRLANKIDKGLLMSYELNGDPIKLIYYIKSIFYNTAKTEIEKKRSSKIYKKVGINLKTLKLYVEKIKQGKINIDRDIPENFTFTDLTEDEIFKIAQKKTENQKHKKTGFVSQRDLLANLRNEVFLDGLEKNGHPLKKCGETTLKKALQKLKQGKKINFSKEKNALYYQETDIPTIADELTKYFNNKRKK